MRRVRRLTLLPPRGRALKLALLFTALGLVLGPLQEVVLSPASAPQAAEIHDATIAVYFSPHGGCTAAIVAALEEARQSVRIQAYSFTSAPIAQAVVAAHRRGVRVEVLLDKSQRTEQYSAADFLAHAGVPTRIDAAHKIAHDKVIVIDNALVFTGSFNFTKSAELNNAENLLLIRSREVGRTYTHNWELHAAHSEPSMGRGR